METNEDRMARALRRAVDMLASVTDEGEPWCPSCEITTQPTHLPGCDYAESMAIYQAGTTPRGAR